MAKQSGRLVALALEGEDFAAALAAAWERGHAVVPLPPGLPLAERSRILGELRPGSVVDPSGETELSGGEPVAPGVAVVALTSGSGGAPKGVELTHQALEALALASAARLGTQSGDRWLLCVPPQRIAGLAILVRSRLLGRAPVIHRRFDPGAIASVDANLVSVVPAMLVRLLDAGIDLGRWRRILLGGGPAPPGLVRRAGEAGAHVVTTYGMTETCGGCVYDGAPLDGVETRVDAEGIISLRGPMLMRAYRRRPDLTRRALTDGWFRTADAGEPLPGGGLRVLGRADDVIVTGGHKVWPDEVAARLGEHPSVAEAAIVGRPDRAWGERVVAVIVPTEAEAPPELADLRDFVAVVLERHKAPTELVCVPELARLPSDKPDPAGLGRGRRGSRDRL